MHMFRTPSLVLTALLLMGSVTAFAADTPDPSTKGKEAGEVALPSGSNTNAPPAVPPAGTAAKSGTDAAPATAPFPAEEAKGKPPVAPQ
jgi:hypothetical protein